MSLLLAEVNLRIGEIAREQQPAEASWCAGNAGGSESRWEFFCECGQSSCKALIPLTLTEHDALRRSGQPLLASGHRIPPSVALAHPAS